MGSGLFKIRVDVPAILAYLRGGAASGEVHEVEVRKDGNGVNLPNHIQVDNMVYERGKQFAYTKDSWNFLYVGPYRPEDFPTQRMS